jgi:hypothetical protein
LISKDGSFSVLVILSLTVATKINNGVPSVPYRQPASS